MNKGLVHLALTIAVSAVAIAGCSRVNAPHPPAIDIRDLIAQKKIVVTTWGKCPDGVTMKIINQADEELPLVIPAGTLFVAPPPRPEPGILVSGPSPQYADLVTASPIEFTQTPRMTEGFGIKAFCAHTFGRYVEFRNDYEISAVDADSNLARVVGVLARKPYGLEPSSRASQAAIWIAADDVSYDAIGALVVQYYPNGVIYPNHHSGSRAIEAPEVLLALDILDTAGVDLHAHKIWADRAEILRLAAAPSAKIEPKVGAAPAANEVLSTAPATGADPAAAPKPLRDVRMFRDCPDCPEMMASSQFFEAVGRSEVSFAEWDACAAAGGCNGYRPPDDGRGRGDRPVTHVSYEDATAYARWLAERTHKPYKLVEDGVWYGALHGGEPPGISGPDLICDEAARIGAQFSICTDRAFSGRADAPNPFSLNDMPGNVWEWVNDCADADCSTRALRGGSGYLYRQGLPPSYRSGANVGIRDIAIGFRVAMILPTQGQ